MKILLYVALVVAILSCDKPKSDSVDPEYSDWYTLKAPVDEAIQGVWGDFDQTLLISTLFTTFRSTDKGKTWQLVDQPQNGISGFVFHQDTLFAMNGLIYGENRQILVNAGRYSVDNGKSWQDYRKYNPFFDTTQPSSKLYVNPVTTAIGTIYTINRISKKSPTGVLLPDETPGVITSDGRQINLPQSHQLKSLYLDPKGRLYLAGTDAICGQSSGQGLLFCNSERGRGVVYISKRSLP